MKQFECKCLMILILLGSMAACRPGESADQPFMNEIFYEQFTEDYAYLAIVRMMERQDRACLMTIKLYETSESFREMIRKKYETGEFIPYVTYSSTMGDYTIDLEDLTLRRDISYHDKIRAFPCPHIAPDDDRENLFLRWVHGVESVRGLEVKGFGRSDTAFALSMRGEEFLYYLW